MSGDATPPAIVRTDTDESYRDGNPINLVDTTIDGSTEHPKLTSSGSWRGLARNLTQTSVKEQISRRKYARWRQDKFDEEEQSRTAGASSFAGAERPSSQEQRAIKDKKPSPVVKPDARTGSEAVDFAGRPSTADDESKGKAKTHRKHKRQPIDSEVDILYENQRGSFFCGIPLYSHSSLLNFDPAPWVNKDLKNSAVNITNAQVPDPSWMWVWKSWYVDMSNDVDEEGWQYSFAFGRQFSWHGTHPWFHSFVRRRRWLRKRVKRDDLALQQRADDSMSAAHHLNADYFTIHSKQRGRSPSSAGNPDVVLPRAASYSSLNSINERLAPEDITNLPALMKALRLANIDREKVEAVKLFVANAGEEIVYLEQAIPEVMSRLVFQNSRRQVLEYLRQTAVDAQKHRDEHNADDRPEGKIEKKHIDSLLSAADKANEEIGELEFWSDRKHVLQTTDENENTKEVSFTSPFDEKQRTEWEDDPVAEICGIPEKAEISKKVYVDRRMKGKEKEQRPVSRERPQQEARSFSRGNAPRLGRDEILVPDEDEKDA